MSDRPDIVILMTDEERAVPPYEAPEVLAWRDRTLAGRKWFDEHGVSFQRHYTGSLACVPSRPTIFTGHYPDLHGVTQTDGIGKVYDDSRMRTSPTRPPAARWRPTTTTASSTVPQCSAISTRIRLRRSGFRAGSGPSRTVRCWPTRGFGGTH